MSTERSALFSKQQPRAGFLNWGYLPVTKEIIQAAFQRYNLSKQNMIINFSYGYKLQFKKNNVTGKYYINRMCNIYKKSVKSV